MELPEEFISRYCTNSKISRENFDRRFVCMACTCDGMEEIPHWAAIHNSPESIEAHTSHERCLRDLRELGSSSTNAQD
jgi:hypothetical protein